MKQATRTLRLQLERHVSSVVAGLATETRCSPATAENQVRQVLLGIVAEIDRPKGLKQKRKLRLFRR